MDTAAVSWTAWRRLAWSADAEREPWVGPRRRWIPYRAAYVPPTCPTGTVAAPSVRFPHPPHIWRLDPAVASTGSPAMHARPRRHGAIIHARTATFVPPYRRAGGSISASSARLTIGGAAISRLGQRQQAWTAARRHRLVAAGNVALSKSCWRDVPKIPQWRRWCRRRTNLIRNCSIFVCGPTRLQNSIQPFDY
jgi:hypothetical protein